jgi:hypothetical protein
MQTGPAQRDQERLRHQETAVAVEAMQYLRRVRWSCPTLAARRLSTVGEALALVSAPRVEVPWIPWL